MKLSHKHPLTHIDNPGALRCDKCFMLLDESYHCRCGTHRCTLCLENLSGSCYGCELCRLRPIIPLVHRSCFELPEEIRITYRSHCLLLFQKRSITCDFCKQQYDEKYGYCCGDCNFQIGFGCASKLIRYHEGTQEHVDHFTHRHPLTLLKLDDMMTCIFCNESIDGSGCYGCAPCKFYLHNSCRDEILPEIRYNFHPNHSLSLNDYNPPSWRKNHTCDACSLLMKGLGYGCDTCGFHLHPKCTTLKPNIKYQGHPHLLILVKKISYQSPCEACGFDIINGVFFMRCLECRINFHVQCDPDNPLPPTLLREEHEHSLIHNNEALIAKDDSQLVYCNLCEKELFPEEQFYQCAGCNYFTHVRCAITEVKYDDDEAKLKHFSHEHILMFGDIPEYHFNYCHGCAKQYIQGLAYGCRDCRFYLHKSCAEMPRQIYDNLSHEHYLTLQMTDPLDYSRSCNTCHNAIEGFMYRCDPCNFEMDLHCASRHPSINLISSKKHEVGERIGHFSHRHHLNIIKEEAGLSCELCHKNIGGQCYGCRQCKFYIHDSCGALQPEIPYPYHPRHSLKLLIADQKPGCFCNACCFGIKGLRYRCDECEFDLHPECISLKPNIEYKSHHQHLLTLVENMSFQQQCEACGLTTLDTFFMRCVECDLNFHVQCATTNPQQPPTILHKESGHRLTLIIRAEMLVEDNNNSDQQCCIVCKKERNQEHPAYYYCADFDYYAHVHCVTGVQVQEHVDDEREKVMHFSHRHFLFPLENKRNNDDLVCCACEKNINQANPAYGCDTCEFYLHKSCAKLPSKIQHPFHRHPLMLPSPYSGKHHQCSSCLKNFNGFSYRCQWKDPNFLLDEGCNFNLDLNCSLLTPELKLVSVHKEHTLNIFKELHDNPKCDSCNFIRPNKPTPLDNFYFRCVICGFSRHLLCCSLPQTIEHDDSHHHHRLTLRNNFIDLFDGFDDEEYCCDYCETRRDARESVYHCGDCNFVVDIECVFSEVKLFLEGKHEDVQGRIVSRKIEKIFKASYKYAVESLTEEEKKLMESLMEIKKGTLQLIFKELKDISQQANARISDELSKIDEDFYKSMARKVMQLESIEEELVDVGGGYKICRKLAPVLNKLLGKYPDIGASCTYTQRLKTISLTALCLIMQEMSDTQLIDIKDDSIIFWWFHLKLVEKAGFRTDFALDLVKRIVHVHFLIDDDDEGNIKRSPFYRIHKEIAESFKSIEKERKKIEILEKEAQDRVSTHGSGKPMLEATRLNEILRSLPYKATFGLLDDFREL